MEDQEVEYTGVAMHPLRGLNGQIAEFIFPNGRNAEHLCIGQDVIVQLRVLCEHLFQPVLFRQADKIGKTGDFAELPQVGGGAAVAPGSGDHGGAESAAQGDLCRHREKERGRQKAEQGRARRSNGQREQGKGGRLSAPPLDGVADGRAADGKAERCGERQGDPAKQQGEAETDSGRGRSNGRRKQADAARTDRESRRQDAVPSAEEGPVFLRDGVPNVVGRLIKMIFQFAGPNLVAPFEQIVEEHFSVVGFRFGQRFALDQQRILRIGHVQIEVALVRKVKEQRRHIRIAHFQVDAVAHQQRIHAFRRGKVDDGCDPSARQQQGKQDGRDAHGRCRGDQDDLGGRECLAGQRTFREIDGEGHAVVGGDIVRGIAQYRFARFRGPFDGLPFPFAVEPGIGGRRNGLKGQADGGGKLLDGRLVPGAEHVELEAVALYADRDGEIVRKSVCAHVAVRDAVALETEIDDQESAFVFGIGHVAAHVGVSFAAVEGQAAINAVSASHGVVDGDAFLHAEGASAHVVKVDGILCKGVSGGGAHRAEGQEDRRGEQQRQQEGEGDAPRLHRFIHGSLA